VLELQRQVEEARAEQNKISKRIREAGKDKAQRDALIAEGKLLAEQIKAMEPLLHELEETRQQLLYLVPNIPDPSTPIGKDENDNVPIGYWGEKPTFDFQPLDHYALMQKLVLPWDMVDNSISSCKLISGWFSPHSTGLVGYFIL
jgi:seryl-tRNA synthetase